MKAESWKCENFEAPTGSVIQITKSSADVGHRCFSIEGHTFNVGDVIKGMRLYVDNERYIEANVRLISTNVRKKSARFKVI